MAGNDESVKETPHASVGQKSRNKNQNKSKQFTASPESRKTIVKPSCSAAADNASGVIEQHQSASLNENAANTRLKNSHETGGDDNSEKVWRSTYNRRRGNTVGCKSDNRGRLRGGYTSQDRRHNNSRNTNGSGGNENRNGKWQNTRGGNGFRSNSRRQGHCQDTDPGGMAEGQYKNNTHIANLHDGITTERNASTAGKPNAWTDNMYPITKSFESSALKELLPGSVEEETEMLELAMKLSLEELKRQPHDYANPSHERTFERAVRLSLEDIQRHNGDYTNKSLERKWSNSSETEVFINEAEEAEKMLRTDECPPLSLSTPDAAFPKLIPDSTIVAQFLTKGPNKSQRSGTDFSRMDNSCADGKNEIDRSTPEVWNQLGARPKKKSPLPTGRGIGRGRIVTEGKIGELVSTSGSAHSGLPVPPAVITTPNMMKPKSPASLDAEQFKQEEVPPDIPSVNVGFGAAQKMTSAKIVSSQDEMHSINSPVEPSGVSNPEYVKAVSNTTQQVKVLLDATQHAKVPGSAEQPVNLDGNLIETMSMHSAARVPVEMPLTCDVAEMQNIVKEEPQHGDIPAKATVITDNSKDEVIRALKEEVNRLKQGQDGNHYESAHFPPPYGVLPVHVPYLLPMPCYRYPFPGIPIVRNDGGAYNSSFAPVPYISNSQAVYPQEMIPMPPSIIPGICNDVTPGTQLSISDIVDRPDLNSSLSPNAEVFHPRQVPPEFGVNKRSNRDYDDRKGRPRQQNHRRGNTRNFHLRSGFDSRVGYF